MPQLPKYERQAGPERYQPYAPRQDYGGAIGQGVANLGQGLMDIGQAIHGAQKSLENSQAEQEFGKAVNLARQRVNDFQLSLSEDQEFMLYDEKYKDVSESITKDVTDILQTKSAKDQFSLWWDATNEAERFRVAELSQKKNLEWQVETMEETIDNTVIRGDEYAKDDVKALLEGARNRGLINHDKAQKIAEKAEHEINVKIFEKVARSLGLEEGIKWSAMGARDKEFGITKEDRKQVSESLEWEYKQITISQKTQLDKAKAIANSEAVDAWAARTLTPQWVQKRFEPVEMSDLKEHWMDRALKIQEDQLKGIAEKPYVTDKIWEGKLSQMIHDPKVSRKQCEQALDAAQDRGIRNQPKGISIEDYRQLYGDMNKFKPDPAVSTKADTDYAFKTAQKIFEESGMIEEDIWVSVSAFNEWRKDTEGRGEKIDNVKVIEVAKEIANKRNVEKIEEQLKTIPPLTSRPGGLGIKLPEIPGPLAMQRAAIKEEPTKTIAKQTTEEKNIKIMALDAFKRETMQNPDQEMYMPKEKLWAFRKGDIWYAYDEKNKKMYRYNIKDKKPEWK